MTLGRPRLAAGAAATLVLLAGCGSEVGSTAGSAPDPTAAGTTSAPPAASQSARPSPTGAQSPSRGAPGTGLGTLVDITPLRTNADVSVDAPIQPATEVTGAAELAATYAGLPGVEAAVDSLEATPPATDERVFVYVTAACRMDDLSLDLRGNRLTMVILGNSTLRCAPPPLSMVVWKVAAADLPADVVPQQAVQK